MTNYQLQCICPICGGNKDCRAEMCRECRKRLYIYSCNDCGKKVTKQTTKRCQECYNKWQIVHPELQSNYIDGRSKRYCVDCNKSILYKSSTILRCWDCHLEKLHKEIKPFPNCIDCGKELKYRNARRCNPCGKKNLSNNAKNRIFTVKTRKKLSKGLVDRWKNQEYKNKTVKNILKANNIFPNKCEIIIKNILKTFLFNNYKYVGAGNHIINGFNPDFINKKDHKIIEFYGDYWHNKPDYIERDIRRLISYKKYGYQTLIIWESELRTNIDYVVGKILAFEEIK